MIPGKYVTLSSMMGQHKLDVRVKTNKETNNRNRRKLKVGREDLGEGMCEYNKSKLYAILKELIKMFFKETVNCMIK